jgi:hypothetical protein
MRDQADKLTELKPKKGKPLTDDDFLIGFQVLRKNDDGSDLTNEQIAERVRELLLDDTFCHERRRGEDVSKITDPTVKFPCFGLGEIPRRHEICREAGVSTVLLGILSGLWRPLHNSEIDRTWNRRLLQDVLT